MLRFSSFFAAAAIAGNVHGFDEKAALNESQAAIGRQVEITGSSIPITAK
jgi:hypothetical protein